VLVHGYPGIDLDAVWDVLEQDLTGLSAAVERMIGFVEGGSTS